MKIVEDIAEWRGQVVSWRSCEALFSEAICLLFPWMPVWLGTQRNVNFNWFRYSFSAFLIKYVIGCEEGLFVAGS